MTNSLAPHWRTFALLILDLVVFLKTTLEKTTSYYCAFKLNPRIVKKENETIPQ